MTANLGKNNDSLLHRQNTRPPCLLPPHGGSLKCGRAAVRADSQEVLQMEANTEETHQGIVVPASVLLKRLRSRSGSPRPS